MAERQLQSAAHTSWEALVWLSLENASLPGAYRLTLTHTTEGATASSPSLVSRQLPSFYPSGVEHTLPQDLCTFCLYVACSVHP